MLWNSSRLERFWVEKKWIHYFFNQKPFNCLEHPHFLDERFTIFPLDINVIPEYFHSRHTEWWMWCYSDESYLEPRAQSEP